MLKSQFLLPAVIFRRETWLHLIGYG